MQYSQNRVYNMKGTRQIFGFNPVEFKIWLNKTRIK